MGIDMPEMTAKNRDGATRIRMRSMWPNLMIPSPIPMETHICEKADVSFGGDGLGAALFGGCETWGPSRTRFTFLLLIRTWAQF